MTKNVSIQECETTPYIEFDGSNIQELSTEGIIMPDYTKVPLIATFNVSDAQQEHDIPADKIIVKWWVTQGDTPVPITTNNDMEPIYVTGISNSKLVMQSNIPDSLDKMSIFATASYSDKATATVTQLYASSALVLRYVGKVGAKGDRGLQGEQGIRGIQGEKGDKGDKGDRGDDGTNGKDGKDGAKGETGAQGLTGLSAYDEAVDMGFVGSVAEWLASFKGAQGIKGDKGDQGIAGAQGLKGDTGATGKQGEKGDKGEIPSTFEVSPLFSAIVANPFYGELRTPLKPYYTKQITNIAKTLTSETLNIGFITDVHYQLGYSPNALQHYNHILSLSRATPNLDTLILGGDNINGDVSKDVMVQQTEILSSFVYGRSNSDVFLLLGNHDRGIGQKGGLQPTTTMSNLELKALYKTSTPYYGEEREGDSLYGYKDYSQHKVRIIFLNSYDLPDVINSDGTWAYNSLLTGAYGNNQLNWVVSNALQLPDDDWGVMLFTHAPLPSTFIEADTPQYNGLALLDILKAFNTKTPYKNTTTEKDFPIDIEMDFTKSKGKLIGVVSGHTHTDGLLKQEGINFIETTASLCYTKTMPSRIVGTETEDAWDVFSIDNENKRVNIARFGAFGTSRSFTF